MKKWRVIQRKYSRYPILGRTTGELVDQAQQDYRWKWQARFAALTYSGVSAGGLLYMTTEIVDTASLEHVE